EQERFGGGPHPDRLLGRADTSPTSSQGLHDRVPQPDAVFARSLAVRGSAAPNRWNTRCHDRSRRSGVMARVVILGAGFGGLEVASRLSAEFGADAGVVLIDQADSFVFGYAKLDVMFGRTEATAVRHRYTDLAKPGVRFVAARVTAIDPVARRV